jgi:hypothetical protein
MTIPNDFDFTIVLFLNKFVGKSRSLDGLVELISDTPLLNGGILFVAFLWLICLGTSAKTLGSVCARGLLQPFWREF